MVYYNSPWKSKKLVYKCVGAKEGCLSMMILYAQVYEGVLGLLVKHKDAHGATVILNALDVCRARPHLTLLFFACASALIT